MWDWSKKPLKLELEQNKQKNNKQGYFIYNEIYICIYKEWSELLIHAD